MTGLEALVFTGLCYVVLDMVLAGAYGRCVLPGLKCKACRK